MKFNGNDPKQQQRFTIITVILVLVVGIAASFYRGGPDTEGYLTFSNEGYLELRDEAGSTLRIPYGEILTAEYVEAPDFGEPKGGSQTEELRLGQWESSQFGLYTNCTQIAISSCVRLETAQGTCVISLESDETTQELCRALQEARDASKTTENP